MTHAELLSDVGQAKAEVTMSNELWWRAAALEALKALILTPLVSSKSPDSVRLQRRIAAILQPTLTVVLASPVLQVQPCFNFSVHEAPRPIAILKL